MDIGSDIRARIIAAAEQLYEADNERFPTVDQVRRAARADMNSTSTVMKEWRRQQTAAPAAVAVAIPERISEAMNTALATVWTEAQELANESLAAAQQAWEIERLEADAMRSELAEAYELQAVEFDTTQRALAQSNEALEGLTEQLNEQENVLADTAARLSDVERREQDAQARIEELRAELGIERAFNEKQVAEHRAELAAVREQAEKRAHADQLVLDEVRQRLEQALTVHANKIAEQQAIHAGVTQELATVSARAEAEQAAALSREQDATEQRAQLARELAVAQQDAAQARETAAELNGQFVAVTAQNKELMAVLGRADRSHGSKNKQ